MNGVIVIGGGPAGMMAAGTAAGQGHAVLLLEKNERLGRKLSITGKGRCNVTNAASTDELLARVNTNPRFLYSAFDAFSSGDVMDFFEACGVPLKIERGRRVFPVSDRAADIVGALADYMRRSGVKLLTGTEAQSVAASNGQVSGIRTASGLFFPAEAVIIATGGLSYPVTGSTGDGYKMAKSLGHKVTKLYPALTPLAALEPWIPSLAGLTLKNVRVTAKMEGCKRPLYEEQGELLFTHEGISGPLALSASRFVTDKLDGGVTIVIDLKPALSHEVLDERIQRDFQLNINKDFANSLDGLLPGRLTAVIVALSGIEPGRKIHDITKKERHSLGMLLKNLAVTPAAAGFKDAVITMGGVDVREINPSTLMSKKINGLYFAGEVLDVDAMTGGYNLQIAFSTGRLAGSLKERVVYS